MSTIRWAEYSRHLVGKTIKAVRWFNDELENFRSLDFTFDDNTRVSFRFRMILDEEAELSDFINGDLSNEKPLRPTPVRRPIA